MAADRLGEMLEGRTSIDVTAAVGIARAFELSADRIMQMQLRRDFSDARALGIGATGVLRATHATAFPDGHLRGRLGRAQGGAGGFDALLFREDVGQRTPGDEYAGIHALWRGDLLRVYGPSAVVVWSGPILQDLDGHLMLPYVRSATWHGWFASAYLADLALGADHAAYLASAER